MYNAFPSKVSGSEILAFLVDADLLLVLTNGSKKTSSACLELSYLLYCRCEHSHNCGKEQQQQQRDQQEFVTLSLVLHVPVNRTVRQ